MAGEQDHAREARRRRILARGSDRLAYITGERKVLPISSKSSETIETQGSLPSFGEVELHRSNLEAGNGLLVDGSKDGSLDGDGKDGGASQKPELSEALPKSNVEELPELFVHELDRSVEQDHTLTPGFDFATNLDAAIRSAWSEDSQNYKGPGQISTGPSLGSSLRRWNHSINASQGARAGFALGLALVFVCKTVLLCCGHPLGAVLDAWLPPWPIAIVFLTSLTLAVGTFILCPVVELVEAEEIAADSGEDPISKFFDVASQLGDLLNIGLFCKKAFSAVLLDCGFYVVALVCGLPLAQFWFSSCCKSSYECRSAQ